MGVLIDDHAMNLRDARVRKVLSDARASLVGHMPRERRIAAAFELARSNVAKFDPKRFPSLLAPVHAERLHRQAAAARQERVKRTLNDARDTLRRVAYVQATSHTSTEVVHKEVEDARVGPEVPSPTSRRTEAATVSAVAMKDLVRRFDTLREAVLPEVVAELRTEWQRELHRELDITHRELELLRRTVAGLPARPL